MGIPIFLIFEQSIDCGYSLEPPRFLAKIRKISIFSTENFKFLQLKKIQYIAWACFRNEITAAKGSHGFKSTNDVFDKDRMFMAYKTK